MEVIELRARNLWSTEPAGRRTFVSMHSTPECVSGNLASVEAEGKLLKGDISCRDWLSATVCRHCDKVVGISSGQARARCRPKTVNVEAYTFSLPVSCLRISSGVGISNQIRKFSRILPQGSGLKSWQ